MDLHRRAAIPVDHLLKQRAVIRPLRRQRTTRPTPPPPPLPPGCPSTLSVDPSSTSGCAISGATVSYGNGAGTCIIDANQPGNDSYLPAAQVTQRFTISPAPLSITASSPAMTYGGTVPAITPTYSGFAGHDSPSSLSAPPSCSTTATSASPAGTYPSACSGAADLNYTISYIPGTVTIKKATTTTTLTSHLNPPVRRNRPRLKLTATVIPRASAETPAGDVNFYVGTPAHHHRQLGTVSLTTTGTAVLTTTLACGRHRLYAVYVGNANDKGSTSATIRCSCHSRTGGTDGNAKPEAGNWRSAGPLTNVLTYLRDGTLHRAQRSPSLVRGNAVTAGQGHVAPGGSGLFFAFWCRQPTLTHVQGPLISKA